MRDEGALSCRTSDASRPRVTLRQSNARFAARLVHRQCGSYARALSCVKVLERGGEGPRLEYGPNNYSNYTNKKNWAAFVRPIFLHRRIGNVQG